MTSTSSVCTGRIKLRPIDPEDESFLFEVYASTRADELAQVNWSPEQRRAFLRMQHEAQSRFYRAEYPGATFDAIEWDGQPVGRFYVHRRPAEIRIMDIALLPEFRGRGIGSRLLTQVLAEATQLNRPVTIHVEVFNPAVRLYERMGFRQVVSNGLYRLLEWKPNSESSVRAAELELTARSATR